MNIWCLASEVDPFAKTGGLADVDGALPKAPSGLGDDVRVVLPLCRQVARDRFGLRPTAHTVTVPLGPASREGRMWEGVLPKSRVPAYFVECAALFDREALYQVGGKDYPDNLERFSFFSQAALALPAQMGWRPDIVHAHDWQAALACAHLALGPAAQDPFLASAGTVFTVHNLAYQGLFPKTQWPLTRLPESAFTIQGLEYYDQINCLKGGLVTADSLTTVSPTYVQEIQTPAFGCGLEGVLGQRREALVGILNGIDMEEWNPQTDPHIPARYSAGELAGKSLCK